MASDNAKVIKLLLARPRTNTESMPKIQRVQPHLRRRDPRGRDAKLYSPKLVSIGPIYRHKDYEKDLQQGEKYKSMWAAMYLEGISTCSPLPNSTEQIALQLLQVVRTNMPTLKEYYTEDAIEGHNDEDLPWIFFVDGCAVLYFMENAGNESPRNVMIKVDQRVIVLQDLLLLENQLPFQLLRLLCNNDGKLLTSIKKFFSMHHMISHLVPDMRIPDQVTHLLDFLRRVVIGQLPCGGVNDTINDEQTSKTYRNIQELKASGIKVKLHKAGLTDITFKTKFHVAGRLYLSRLIVDDHTALTLMNMIAYEMCPDFDNHYEISSYVAFLDSLIDHPDDVKELRKARILHNMLGSDEEVAELFNTISTDLVTDTKTYGKVRKDIENHYRNKCKTWLFQAYSNHFSSPWTITAFVAAIFALFLTSVQTYFQVWPRGNSNSTGNGNG